MQNTENAKIIPSSFDCFLIPPDAAVPDAGTRISVTLRPHDFSVLPKKLGRPKKSQIAPPQPFVIVGFDTEFQGPDPDAVADGKARNLILSYQYACQTSEGARWTGIRVS